MGYYMGDGAVLGLSEPTVTAAGSDARFVTFKRETENGKVLFYYIEKKPDEVGDVSRPYSVDEYPPIQKAKTLPPHTWKVKS
jgi:hypothetical protein